MSSNKNVAIFAAGCFWGVQYYFDQVPGVAETIVGYTGGKMDNPSYEDVCYRDSGHAEAVKITFDPSIVSYQTLLKHFFRMHDPSQLNRQGPDVGSQYRSAIFYVNEEQKKLAEKILSEVNKKDFNDQVVTVVEAASRFWPAESYHQKFTEKTGRGMCHIAYKALVA